MTAIVKIGELTMEGTYQHRDDVYQVGGQFFSDWYSISDSKSEIRERPAGNGAHGIAHDWRSSLVMEMTGWFRGASWLPMMNALRSAVSSGSMVTVAVTDDSGTTSRSVSVRRFAPAPDPGAQVCGFSILMVAPDPFRYGAVTSASSGLPSAGGGLSFPFTYPVGFGVPGNPGRVTTSNPGTADTFSTLEITGGLGGGFELTEITTGQVIRFERMIPLGSTVTLNPRTGMAFLDGDSDVSGFLTRAEWWSVPPGGSRSIQFNSIGAVTDSPTLSVATAAAY
jgi:hypothetical protein